MPYDPTKRDRIEGWPLKGTRAKLVAKAKKRKKSFTAHVNSILEKAAA